MLLDDDLLRNLRDEIDEAEGALSASQSDLDMAEAYFFGQLPAVPDDPDSVGFADVVSTDVADAVESVLSEILPAFTQGPVEFLPLRPGDEAQANIETRTVHHILGANGGYMAINSACRDALLLRAGVLKVAWEDRQDVSYRSLAGIPIELAAQAMASGADVLTGLQREDGLVDLTLRERRQCSRPRIDVVPRGEFLISLGADVLKLDEARFLAHTRGVMRSDLVAWGFDKALVDRLVADDTEDESAHASTDTIRVVDAYYRIDRDEDGIAELLRCITAGGDDGTSVLLFAEPCADQPFCVGVPYLGLHTWEGVSLFDKLKAIQDVKTELLRDLLDASRRSARQRIGAVERDANVTDLLTSSRGGVIRCKTPQGVFPINEGSVPPSLFSTLQYMDKVRRDKGGGAIDSAEQSQVIAGDTAHGIERMMASAEQINAMLARNLAETLIKPLYLKMHRLLRRHQSDAVMLPSPSGWQQVRPSEWCDRNDLVLSMGMSTGERSRRIAALLQIGGFQKEAMQAGLTGQLVGLNEIYQTLTDLGNLAGLPNPEQYWINPKSPQSLQAQQAAAQQAQQAKLLAQQSQQQAVELAKIQATALQQTQQIKSQTDLQLQDMKDQLKQLELALNHQAKMFAEQVKLVGVEAKIDAAEAMEDVEDLQTGPAGPDRGEVEDQQTGPYRGEIE